MKEEILKWLNTEIIYPISDSQWVSMVYIVPKKAWVTATINENDKEIKHAFQQSGEFILTIGS